MIDYKTLSTETVLLLLKQIHTTNCKKLDCAECNVFSNLEIKNWLEQ
jgi:hypothetical protein